MATLTVTNRAPALTVAGYPPDRPLPCGWERIGDEARSTAGDDVAAALGGLVGTLLRWEGEVVVHDGEQRRECWFDDTDYGVWVAHGGGKRGLLCLSLPYDRRLFDPMLVVLVSYVPYAYWVDVEPTLTTRGANEGPRRDQEVRSAAAWLVTRNRLRLSAFERALFLAALAEQCPVHGERCTDERCGSSH
ncbi:MAG: hypothetical protein NZ761_07275 [Dehalococcoidia bacterium]|nr:hypothetical protein [Dehalococcoidia bacterium]